MPTLTRDTIVAVATPPGAALRAVVRMSGPAVRTLGQSLLHTQLQQRGVTRQRLHLTGVTCPCVACFMEGPASFTGEDSLELSLVGSSTLIELVCAHAIAGAQQGGFPARMAQRGEFAFRAHLGGKISIEEAEGIAARIAATTDAEIIAADEIAHGDYGVRVTECVAQLAQLLARVEAGIDFTDAEDVVAIEAGVLHDESARVVEHLRALRGEPSSSQASSVALVVLAGNPNAGKSSLFNALLGRARTVEHAQAGTTRDAIVERLHLGGSLEVDLADLAGLEECSDDVSSSGNASAEIHNAMQQRARDMLARADIVLRCTPHDAAPAALVTSAPVLDVATMIDRASSDRAADLHHRNALGTSARTGAGVAHLRAVIRERVQSDHALRGAQLAHILPRYDAALARALDALDASLQRSAIDRASGVRISDIEVVASLLRAALDALGEVAQPVHPDDILGLVFSRFCIGK